MSMISLRGLKMKSGKINLKTNIMNDDRNFLIGIRDSINIFLYEEPIEQPEQPEPIEDNAPITNITTEVIAPNMVRVRWKAHTERGMDIVYHLEGEKEWKHSVKKYTGKSIPITDQSVVIGFNKTLDKKVYFKAVVGEWEKEITERYKAPVEPTPVPEPEEPVIDQPIEEPNPEPTPEPEDSFAVEMALVFLGGDSFDAWVNDEKVKDEFDYTFPKPDGVSAGVKIVKLSEKFKTLVIDKTKGHKGIKVVNRDPDNDLTRINANHTNEGDPNFWGQPAKSSFPLGVIYGPLGDTTQPEGEKVPDPLFWRGWREDPINRPNDRDFHSQWSDTGKIVISFLS